MATGLFERFKEPIRHLPAGELTLSHFQPFRLASEGNIEVYYAPFDYINSAAKVAIVGITPGFYQMRLAFEAARDSLQRAESDETVLFTSEKTGCFAGAMRTNIASMLNELGVAAALGIGSTAEMFNEQRHLLHTTSAVRYPVFVGGKNYTGHSPKLERSEFLMGYISDLLAHELQQIKDALIVPCGESVSEALSSLSQKGLLDARRCLVGFPHPSGANGHRKPIFERNKRQMTKQVSDWAAIHA